MSARPQDLVEAGAQRRDLAVCQLGDANVPRPICAGPTMA